MHAIEPIGYFHSEAQERYAVGRQGGILQNQGSIILNAGLEQALEDLIGFDRIWLIYGFHRNTHWKPKVLPPRGDKKRGVFATRSPHRPNFLGLSCVKLKSIQGRNLEIEEHDLIEGTPVYDIKPYLVYADSFPDAKQGWLESLEQQPSFIFNWSELALKKAEYLQNVWNIAIESNIVPRLMVNPFPSKNNRIRVLREGFNEIAYKSWRVSFTVEENRVNLVDIYSGYAPDTVNSKWDDLMVHEAFRKQFC